MMMTTLHHFFFLLLLSSLLFAGISNSLCSDSTTSFREKMISTSSVSLSDMLSSPERYAEALNLTTTQVKEQKELHQRASDDLHRKLQSKHLSGKEKHELMCRHRLAHGRHPFSCPRCWSYLPVCVCDLAEKQQSSQLLGKRLEVVVWCHHREWGLTSNTGCMLSLTLPNCKLLMKGLPEHDRVLQETVLGDENCLAVVLWPSDQPEKPTNEKTDDDLSSSPPAISLDRVRREIEDDRHKRVALIVVDGTWRNARRMVKRLPPSVHRLDLSEDVVYSCLADDGDRSSILAPLRSRGESGRNTMDDGDDPDGGGGDNRQVCTAEAVVGALMGLEALDREQGRHILSVTKTKVDRVFRYRGKARGDNARAE